MSFAITAEFPLGTYRAGIGEGELDPYPSPSRLHSALLNAAAQGLSAQDTGSAEGMMPSPESLAALRWLEEHPPEGLAIPHHHRNRSDAMAFRDLAMLRPKKQGTKKTPKRDHANVAVGGSFMWVWSEEPPKSIFDHLSELCPDVPYLGRADSPVRLRAIRGEFGDTTTHRREAAPSLRDTRRSDVDLPAPSPGRSAALIQHHLTGRGSKPPSLAADRVTTDESELRAPVIDVHTEQHRYRAISEQAAPSPWTSAWLLPIEGSEVYPVQPDDKVRSCVAAHRALIALHGDGAPSVLTGNYGKGNPPPANRVAIQLIDRHPRMSERALNLMRGEAQAFVIAVPEQCSDADRVVLSRLVARLDHVRRDRRSELRIKRGNDTTPALLDATRYWAEPREGTVRVWRSAPTVAESRRLQDPTWRFRDAVAYSIGLVFRDGFSSFADLPWEERVRTLSSWVLDDKGAEVLRTRRVASAHPERYVHRVQEGMIVDPFSAVLSLGKLSALETMFLAIGQPRHLGGGLLTPIDLEEDDLDFWRNS